MKIGNVVKGTSKNPGANTVNKEGFPAYKRDGIKRLREMLFLGSTLDTCYCLGRINTKERAVDIINIINDKNIPIESISELICSARNDGYFRHMPIIALCVLRKRSPEEFRKIFDKVILTGQDLYDFLDINRGLEYGLGRSVKKSIEKWIDKNLSVYYALKYKKQIGLAIRVARIRSKGTNKEDLIKYILNDKNYVIKNETINLVKKIKNKAPLTETLLSEIKNSDIPADVLIGICGNSTDNKLWSIIAEKMKTMQFIKYINKLINTIGEEKVIELMSEKVTPEKLRAAKVFPYSLYVLKENVNSRTVKRKVSNIINEYIDKYGTEVPKMDNCIVCLDISGSMMNNYGPFSVKPFTVGAYFASAVKTMNRESNVILWGIGARYYENTRNAITAVDIFDDINIQASSIQDRGTNMASPIIKITKENIYADTVLIITDSEHWYGNKTFMEAWKEYKENVNKKAKCIIIEVVGYGTEQYNKDFSEKYDVFTVFGWNDSVFEIIKEILNR